MINKTAIVQTNTSGNTEIVAAISGHRIRVLAFVLTAGGNENVKFQSASTDITGFFYLGTHGVLSSPSPIQTPAGVQYQFQTASGEALNINLAGTSDVGGYVIYQVVRE
jgi:hypothetical protein